MDEGMRERWAMTRELWQQTENTGQSTREVPPRRIFQRSTPRVPPGLELSTGYGDMPLPLGPRTRSQTIPPPRLAVQPNLSPPPALELRSRVSTASPAGFQLQSQISLPYGLPNYTRIPRQSKYSSRYNITTPPGFEGRSQGSPLPGHTYLQNKSQQDPSRRLCQSTLLENERTDQRHQNLDPRSPWMSTASLSPFHALALSNGDAAVFATSEPSPIRLLCMNSEADDQDIDPSRSMQDPIGTPRRRQLESQGVSSELSALPLSNGVSLMNATASRPSGSESQGQSSFHTLPYTPGSRPRFASGSSSNWNELPSSSARLNPRASTLPVSAFVTPFSGLSTSFPSLSRSTGAHAMAPVQYYANDNFQSLDPRSSITVEELRRRNANRQIIPQTLDINQSNASSQSPGPFEDLLRRAVDLQIIPHTLDVGHSNANNHSPIRPHMGTLEDLGRRAAILQIQSRNTWLGVPTPQEILERFTNPIVIEHLTETLKI